LQGRIDQESGRRPVVLPTQLLNRHLRYPGHSFFAGLSAPLVLRSRDARSQLRQSGRSAVLEVSSRKMKTGRAGMAPVRNPLDKDKSHADHEG
jgi:hypothetical protein